MAASIGLFVVALVLFGPLVGVVGLVLWGRRLEREGARRAVVWMAYGVATAAALIFVNPVVQAWLHAREAVPEGGVEPSQKARVLAERISEAMNGGTLATMVLVGGGVGIGAWRWWERRVGEK